MRALLRALAASRAASTSLFADGYGGVALLGSGHGTASFASLQRLMDRDKPTVSRYRLPRHQQETRFTSGGGDTLHDRFRVLRMLTHDQPRIGIDLDGSVAEVI